MRKYIKIAAKCSIRYYISAIFTLFAWFSIMAIATMSMTTVNGYTAYDPNSNEVLYNYYYDQGEDSLKAQYENQGITVETVELRSTIEGTDRIVVDSIAQVIGLIILTMFMYKHLWQLGDNDSNLASFDHAVINKLRGVYIGAMASVPSFVAWIVLVLAKAGIVNGKWYTLFRLMSFQSFMLVDTVFGRNATDVTAFTWPSIFAALTVFLVLPIICGISYIMGVKNVRVFEKLVYKKGV